MFAAHKESDIIVLEHVIYALVSAMCFRTLIISLLAIIPKNFLIVSLCSIVILCAVLLLIEFLSNFSFLPTTTFFLLTFLLLYLCVIYNPTYLPVQLKYGTIIVCIVVSLFPIRGILTNRDYRYIYQFELISKVKLELIIWYVILIFDIIDSASSNNRYILFVCPVVVMIVMAGNLDNKKVANNVLYLFYAAFVVSICFYDYFVYNIVYQHLAINLLWPVCVLASRECMKRKTVFLLAIIVAFCELFVYLNIFKFLSLSEIQNLLLQIIGLIINLLSLAALFIKFKQKSVRALFSHFTGIYEQKDITLQLENYIKKYGDDNFLDSVVKAAKYASEHNIISRQTEESIEHEAELYDNVITNNNANKLSPVNVWFHSSLSIMQRHWKLPASILFLLVCLPVLYSGIYRKLSNFLDGRGILSPVLEISHCAFLYSNMTLQQLSDNENINEYASFSQYIAEILEANGHKMPVLR